MTTTPLELVTPAPEADAARRAGLRRMRTVAVLLLALAGVVFVVTLDQDGFLGYVNAGAEASMVGAIADWFAVTALFKHPLGLPIPHTALIPRKKDDLGRSLEQFVGENFLQEQIIRERVAAANISLRVGAWAKNRGTHAGSSTRSPTWLPSAWPRSATSTSSSSWRACSCLDSGRSPSPPSSAAC